MNKKKNLQLGMIAILENGKVYAIIPDNERLAVQGKLLGLELNFDSKQKTIFAKINAKDSIGLTLYDSDLCNVSNNQLNINVIYVLADYETKLKGEVIWIRKEACREIDELNAAGLYTDRIPHFVNPKQCHITNENNRFKI